MAAALEKVFPNKTDAAIARYFAVVPKKNVRSIFKEIDRQRDRSDRPGTTDTTWIELPVLAERKNYDSFTDWLKEDENSAYPYVSRLRRRFSDRIKIITPTTTSAR